MKGGFWSGNCCLCLNHTVFNSFIEYRCNHYQRCITVTWSHLQSKWQTALLPGLDSTKWKQRYFCLCLHFVFYVFYVFLQRFLVMLIKNSTREFDYSPLSPSIRPSCTLKSVSQYFNVFLSFIEWVDGFTPCCHLLSCSARQVIMEDGTRAQEDN